MAERIGVPKAKPGELIARWGRPELRQDPDLCYANGGGGADRSDRRILAEAMEGAVIFEGRNLRQELEARGYDITTLRFSVSMKHKGDASNG
jgi:hypothetical protein